MASGITRFSVSGQGVSEGTEEALKTLVGAKPSFPKRRTFERKVPQAAPSKYVKEIPDLKNTIAEIAKIVGTPIPDDNQWIIVDYEPKGKLVKVDVQKEYNTVEPWNSVKGIVVDMNTGLILSRSLQSSSISVSDHLQIENGNIVFEGEDGIRVNLPVDDTVIRPFSEGPTIVVFRRGGKT